MAVFISAFDASGTDNTPILSVGGFVSSAQDWDLFSEKWEHRLSQDGLLYFRAVEFAHSRGQFEGWKDQKARRIKLSGDLMRILLSHTYRKFACTIVNKDFAALSKSLQDEYVLTAYSLAGRTCEVLVRNWRRFERIEGHVEPVFEEGDADQEKLRRRLSHDLGYEPTFRPKKDAIMPDGSTRPRFVPLQAADWLAYETNLAVRTIRPGQLVNEKDLRWPMQQFMTITGEWGVYGAEELKTLDENLSVMKKLSLWWKEHNL